MLKRVPDGTYLVRYSSRAKAYTLSLKFVRDDAAFFFFSMLRPSPTFTIRCPQQIRRRHQAHPDQDRRHTLWPGRPSGVLQSRRMFWLSAWCICLLQVGCLFHFVAHLHRPLVPTGAMRLLPEGEALQHHQHLSDAAHQVGLVLRRAWLWAPAQHCPSLPLHLSRTHGMHASKQAIKATLVDDVRSSSKFGSNTRLRQKQSAWTWSGPRAWRCGRLAGALTCRGLVRLPACLCGWPLGTKAHGLAAVLLKEGKL